MHRWSQFLEVSIFSIVAFVDVSNGVCKQVGP